MERLKKLRANYRFRMVITAVKYVFAIVLTILASVSTKSLPVLILGLTEIALIYFVSSLVLSCNRIIGHLVHLVLYFLFCAQMVVMYFSTTYTTSVMLSNLVFLEDLKDNFIKYLGLLIPLFAVLLLPIKEITSSKKRLAICTGAVLPVWLASFLLLGSAYSPMYNVCTLISEEVTIMQMEQNAANQEIVDESEFYRKEVNDYIAKPSNLSKQPNIVLVFMEGLSQNIVEDERQIMPFLKSLEEDSVSFDHYYNHTFATLRGLAGQLYSGFHLYDNDTNALVSIQSILHDAGYHTTFINTEPDNDDFCRYLESFYFDTFLSDSSTVSEDYVFVSDKDAFDLLFDTMMTEKDEGPFFISMYSYGTHMSLDSYDEVFGDSSDAELNKFYNLDQQLETFVGRLQESELASNTIFVLTADHATYRDQAFLNSFPDYIREASSCDRVPFLIYYDGIIPDTIDAQGRNSLDMVPTVLDFLDVSAPNYFLGDSLFCDAQESKGLYDTVFFDGTRPIDTSRKSFEYMSEEDRLNFYDFLPQYFAISRGKKD